MNFKFLNGLWRYKFQDTFERNINSKFVWKLVRGLNLRVRGTQEIIKLCQHKFLWFLNMKGDDWIECFSHFDCIWSWVFFSIYQDHNKHHSCRPYTVLQYLVFVFVSSSSTSSSSFSSSSSSSSSLMMHIKRMELGYKPHIILKIKSMIMYNLRQFVSRKLTDKKWTHMYYDNHIHTVVVNECKTIFDLWHYLLRVTSRFIALNIHL